MASLAICDGSFSTPLSLASLSPNGSVPLSGLLFTYPYKFGSPPANPIGSSLMKRPRSGS